MTRQQLIQKLRPVLLRRRDALSRSLTGELSIFNTETGRSVGDIGDAAVDGEYVSMNANLAEAESRELAEIQEALDRMRAGTYGLCERCGRVIPRSRLEALPYAAMCIRCQRETEKRGRLNGGMLPRSIRMSDQLDEQGDPTITYRLDRMDLVN